MNEWPSPTASNHNDKQDKSLWLPKAYQDGSRPAYCAGDGRGLIAGRDLLAWIMGRRMRKKKTYEDHQRDGEIAINIAALALSKQAIKEEIKAKGERLTLVKPAGINARAKVYLEQHPGLWRLAWERAWHSGQIDESVGVILREIYRRRSVPELYVTPSWPEPLPERGVRRKKKKEPPKEEPPKGVVMLSLAIAGMSFVGLAYWLMS